MSYFRSNSFALTIVKLEMYFLLPGNTTSNKTRNPSCNGGWGVYDVNSCFRPLIKKMLLYRRNKYYLKRIVKMMMAIGFIKHCRGAKRSLIK